MLCCTAATRTRIHLTADQRRRIDQVADAEGVTMAAVVRRAVDAYLADHHVDADAALRATLGADRRAAGPNRQEWDHG